MLTGHKVEEIVGAVGGERGRAFARNDQAAYIRATSPKRFYSDRDNQAFTAKSRPGQASERLVAYAETLNEWIVSAKEFFGRVKERLQKALHKPHEILNKIDEKVDNLKSLKNEIYESFGIDTKDPIKSDTNISRKAHMGVSDEAVKSRFEQREGLIKRFQPNSNTSEHVFGDDD